MFNINGVELGVTGVFVLPGTTVGVEVAVTADIEGELNIAGVNVDIAVGVDVDVGISVKAAGRVSVGKATSGSVARY